MTTIDAGVLGVWEAQWSSSPYAQTTLSYCAYELLPTLGTMIVQRESATSRDGHKSGSVFF